jgi:peptidoglycan/LPS O-acetylase OafA/YrhL
MVTGAIVTMIVVNVAASLLMYAAFRPYTDKLLPRIALGIASFGVLAAILRTAARGEPALAIPVNFVLASIWIAVAFAIIHVVDKWLQSRGTRA